jgi:monoamine oxidase
MKEKETTIFIIGAGVAGLMAAKRLAKHFKVTILEANSRTGGRINTITDGFSQPVEGGAEFIHGKLPETLRLLKKGGIDYEKLEPAIHMVTDGNWQAKDEMVPGWKKLIKLMKKEKEDITLLEFLDIHFGHDDQAEFREQVKGYAEGFDLADPGKASMKTLYREWANTDEEVFRIPGGYSQLIAYLEEECRSRGCEIITGAVVNQIDWEPGDVTIYTEDGRKFMGNKCILTLPMAILKKVIGKASVNITPPLDEYIKAVQHIGYGTAIKMVIEFNEPFWTQNLNEPSFVLSKEVIPTWWTGYPVATPILTGWKGGPSALELSGRTDEDLLKMGLASLANIFRLPASALKEKMVRSKIFNWYCEPFAEGAYSYALLSTGKARELLNTPVRDTIYFAGEGIYSGKAAGTVEAALVNGKEVAAVIKRNKGQG